MTNIIVESTFDTNIKFPQDAHLATLWRGKYLSHESLLVKFIEIIDSSVKEGCFMYTKNVLLLSERG